MSVDFFGKAVEVVQSAVKKDENKEFEEALRLYIHAIEYFIAGLKYSKNELINTTVRRKVQEFLGRSETLKKYCDELEKQRKQKQKQKSGPVATAEDDRSEKILNAILSEKPSVKWEDVAGLENAKRALQEAVIMPAKFPQLFTGKRKAWKGILMYGPPGTGKTHLAKAIASLANVTFFSASAADLTSKFMGESEKMVKQLFTAAIEKQPSIIFLDEIDSIAGTRSDSDSEASKRLKTELLIQMNRAAEERNVVVIAATNRPFDLDSAMRRRFQKRIYIPLPNYETRLQLLKIQLEGEETGLNPGALAEFAKNTDRFSGSDIATLVREALMAPLREASKAQYWKKVMHEGKEKVTPCGRFTFGSFQASLMDLEPDQVLLDVVSTEHFENALSRTRPSVDESDVKECERFTALFGESGDVIAEPLAEEPHATQAHEEPRPLPETTRSRSEPARPKRKAPRQMLAA